MQFATHRHHHHTSHPLNYPGLPESIVVLIVILLILSLLPFDRPEFTSYPPGSRSPSDPCSPRRTAYTGYSRTVAVVRCARIKCCRTRNLSLLSVHCSSSTDWWWRYGLWLIRWNDTWVICHWRSVRLTGASPTSRRLVKENELLTLFLSLGFWRNWI